MIAVRLPVTVERRLEHVAKRTGRAKSIHIREAIENHLDELEDIFIAEKRLEDLRAGRSHTIPLEQVMREHGNLES